MAGITNRAYRNMKVKRELLKEIDLVLEQNNRMAARGQKSVRPNTQENRCADVLKFFSILVYKLHFRIESIMNLQEKHLEGVFKYLDREGEKHTTIMNMLTSMRTFCIWLGKPDMVKEMRHYFPTGPVIDDESDTAPEPNIDPIEILSTINSIGRGREERVAIWLEQCWAFGLTMSQSIMLRPHVDVNGKFVSVREVKRGGSKMNSVQIKTDVQRDLIKRAKLFAGRGTGKIGRPGKDITADLQHFYYVLRKVGISKKLINGPQARVLQDKYHEQMLEILTEGGPQAE